MKLDTLKISVVQRILNLSNDRLLEEISKILDEEGNVGHDTKVNAITENGYIEDMNSALIELREGTMETYTSEEVKQRIFGEKNIVGYDAEGNAVTHEEFLADLENTLQQLENGTLETYTSEEVKRMIFGK